MPNLILLRDKGWVDGWRKYSVWVDHRKVAHIKQGERIAIPISSGEHTLQTRIDWARTRPIRFQVHDVDVIFYVKSGLRGWRMILMWLFLFLPWKWMSLEKST